MINKQYRIGELAEKAGVTRRTVHYYMSRGLLPPPNGAGLGTTYSDEHLFRVMLIKKFQKAYLPLEEIKKRLDRMSLAEVKKNLAGNDHTLQAKESTNNERTVDEPGPGGIGQPYKRVIIGHGLELYFPQGSEKAENLAEELYKYAQKIMKEG